jgi:hypothetical protein
MNANLGSYYFKKIVVGVFPTAFFLRKILDYMSFMATTNTPPTERTIHLCETSENKSRG